MEFDTPQALVDYCIANLKTLDRNNFTELNILIDQLNSVDYQMVKVDSEMVQDILNLLLKLMPEDNDHILSKFCHIIQTFISKLKIVLSQQCHSAVIGYMVNSDNCGKWVLPDVLYALSSLIYGNTERLEKYYDLLVSPAGILLQYASIGNDVNVQLASLKCLQSLTFRTQIEVYLHHHHLVNIFSVCFSCIKASISDINNHMNCKIILTSLKCLQHVFMYKNIPINNLGEFLGLIKALLFCGFPGQVILSPTVLYPALMSLPVPPATKSANNDNSSKSQFHGRKVSKNRSRKPSTKKKNKEKVHKNYDEDSDGASDHSFHQGTSLPGLSHQHEAASDLGDWWRTSSSDSDFSDAEERSAIKLKSLQTAIRQHAYTTLHAVVKSVEKKVIFSYWSSFLPDSPPSSGISNLNIITTILKDPSPQVRLCALGVLTEMMRGSKQFLSLVDDRTPNHTAFVTASSAVTTMVTELHRCLLLALISETTSTVLTQILKCYSTLADVVPYSRLKVDLLLKLLKCLKSFISHKDSQVQVATLTVYGSLLNSEQVPNEALEQIMHAEFGRTDTKDTVPVNNNNSAEKCLPWILTICKDNLLSGRFPPPLPVRVESLQVFRVVCGNYFPKVRFHIELLERIILHNLKEEQPPLQLHGAKLLEVVGRGILNDVNNNPSLEMATDRYINIDIAFNFWDHVLTGPFPACLSNEEQHTLRSVCCDSLSTIPSKIFECLSRRIQVFCMTMLFGLSTESDYNIRGAAVRCLGIYCLFPSLREDLSFLSDVARILTQSVQDSNVVVRAKASWAMGNLSDALFLSRDEFPDFAAQVTVPFFYDIGMASVIASEDCDRIKANAVRALGNLLHYLPSSFLDDEKIKEFAQKAQMSLFAALSAKFMKVCWNACYAFGNILRNDSLVNSGILDLEKILQHLTSMLSSVNSKVRINAVLAITVLPSRHLYGELFPTICNQFLSILSTAGTHVDFKELQHFESLCDTLCFSLCQVLCLANTKDFEAIYKNTLEAKEALLTTMWKFGERATSDKIAIISSAQKRIESTANAKNDDHAVQWMDLWKGILNEAETAYHQK